MPAEKKTVSPLNEVKILHISDGDNGEKLKHKVELLHSTYSCFNIEACSVTMVISDLIPHNLLPLKFYIFGTM